MGIRVVEDSFYPSESKLKGDHDALQFQQVRRYRIHPIPFADRGLRLQALNTGKGTDRNHFTQPRENIGI